MKSQGQGGGDCIRMHLYVHGALWGPCVYMQSVCGRGCVFEWRIKGPHVQGLHGADSWPIKRGPPKAEWKNEIEKKKKETSTSEEAAAVRISKVQRCNRAGWKKGLPQPQTRLKSSANNERSQKVGLKAKGNREGVVGGWVDGWMEQACVLHFPIPSLSCLSCLHPVSN